MITLLNIGEQLFYNSNEVITVKHEFAGMSKCRDRGIVKWQSFNPVPGFGKKLHDSIHNTTEEELTYDDEYRISLDYALSSCNENDKRAAIKYHDGKRYKLVTGTISTFGEGKIGLDTDDGTFVELSFEKVVRIEPL
jgi:hypothetical protein